MAWAVLQAFTFTHNLMQWHICAHTDKTAELGVTVCMRVRDQAATGTSDARLSFHTHTHIRRMMMCGAWPSRLTPSKEEICPTAAAHITLSVCSWCDMKVWTWQLIPVFHPAMNSYFPESVKFKHFYHRFLTLWEFSCHFKKLLLFSESFSHQHYIAMYSLTVMFITNQLSFIH